MNSDAIVTIYSGDQSSGVPASNVSNTSTFTANNSFLIWGNDDAATNFLTAYTPNSFTPTNDFFRMTRIWKVQETGTVGTVTVQVPNNAGYLLVHNSADFNTGTPTEITLIDDGNGNMVATVDFADGEFFTFGRERTPAIPCNSSVAFVHGADDDGGSGVGLSAWLSNGDGTFTTEEISFSGFDRDGSGSEVFGYGSGDYTEFVDLNNDGNLDIAHVTESGGNAIYVYLNNGDNTFNTTNVSTTGMASGTSGVFAGQTGGEQSWFADTNADGNVDYIFSGDDNQIHVWLGNGDGTFATARTSTTLTGVSGRRTSGISADENFFVKDLNGDDSADLLMAADLRFIVWLGNGDGTFTAASFFDQSPIESSGTSGSSGSADNEYSQLADIDADGDFDYIHAESFNSTMQMWVYINNGDGTFATTAIRTDITNAPLVGTDRFANYTAAEQSFVADVTNDGIPDFVTTIDNGGASNGLTTYVGVGDGTFTDNPITTTIASNFQTGEDGTETSFVGCGLIVQPVAPGGVTTDLALWLKANENVYNTGTTEATNGEDVETWSDFSGQNNNATVVSAGNSPTFNSTTRLINFNPTVEFATPDVGASSANKDFLNITDIADVRGAYWVAVNDDFADPDVRHFLYGSDGPDNSNNFHGGVSGSVDLGGVVGTWRKDAGTVNNATKWTGGIDMFSVETSANEVVANVGGNQNTSTPAALRSWDGVMAEVILYSGSASSSERQQIESYLALKYGITQDQTSATDYLASDGTTKMWDATINTAYNNDIAGIGRDDAQALVQKQSKSVNSDAIVTIGLTTIETTNIANTATFANDKNFMVWGNNDGTATWTSTGAPAGFEMLSRQWRVAETGTVAAVKLQVDVADADFDIPTLNNGTSYLLIYDSDNDNDLSDETPVVLTNSSGDIWETTGTIDFTDGMEFTFATLTITNMPMISYGVNGAYDLCSALYDQVALTPIDESNPRDFMFNNDGTRLYILGSAGTDDIDQFDLTVPYNISSATFNSAVLSVNAQEGLPQDMIFNNDGTVLYVVGRNNDNVIQYNLGTAYDIGSVTSNSVAINVGGQDDNPQGMLFNSDGTRFYLLGSSGIADGGENIYQYNLTIPYNISSGSFDSIIYTLTALDSGNASMLYNNDGTILYTIGGDNDTFFKHSLSTPFDISTASYTGKGLVVGTEESAPRAGLFNNDGTIFYVLGNSADDIKQYSLGFESGFVETVANNGEVSGQLAILLSGDTFADGNADGILDPATYTITNLPTGLTATINLFNADGTTANTAGNAVLGIVTLSGNAVNNEDSDDVADLTFVFTDAAFNTETAANVTNATGPASSLNGIDFIDSTTGPGGISTDLALWLKANDGVTGTTAVTQWDDKSSNGLSLTQGTPALQPNANTSLTNFNPTVTFNGLSTVLELSGGLFPSTAEPDFAFYGVYTTDDRNAAQSPWGEDGSSASGASGIFRVTHVNNSRILADLDSSVQPNRLDDTSAPSRVNEQPYIYGFIHQTTSTTRQAFVRDGLEIFSDGTAIPFAGEGLPFYVGSEVNSGSNLTGYHDGNISELIFYFEDHNSDQPQRIQSYLALKYGITLDQTVAQDYLASDGVTKMWDSSVNTTYNDDIFGIGQDDESVLLQNISKSANANAILTASSDTDFTAENTTHTDILDNLEFVTHANNASSAALAIGTDDVNASFTNVKKVNREWNIQEVGDVGCINYKFDVSSLSLAAGDVLFAVIAEDAAFTTNVEIKQIDNTAAEVGVDWTANSTNNYMTIAVLVAADKDPELTDVYTGITTLSTQALPTTSNTYLELSSRANGFVITRVTTANRTAMVQQPGLFVFDTDLNQFFVSNGTNWRTLGSATSKFCN